jgi:hypothetical protein
MKKERDAVAARCLASEPGAKLTFHSSFRPPSCSPYARGRRRGVVGYAGYSDGVVVVNEALFASLAPHSSNPILSPSPLLFPSIDLEAICSEMWKKRRRLHQRVRRFPAGQSWRALSWTMERGGVAVLPFAVVFCFYRG